MRGSFAAQSRFGHLILAPGYPARGEAIAAELTARGPHFARRSEGAAPEAGIPVFFADTLGEMDL